MYFRNPLKPRWRFVLGFIIALSTPWLLDNVEELHDVDQLVLGSDAAKLQQGDKVGLGGVLAGPGVMSLPGELVRGTGPELVSGVLSLQPGGPLVALPMRLEERPVRLGDSCVEGRPGQSLMPAAGPALALPHSELRVGHHDVIVHGLRKVSQLGPA